METLVERVERDKDDAIRFFEEKIARFKNAKPYLKEIAEVLNKEFKPGSVLFYDEKFTFSPEDSSVAFEITSKLLELFPEVEKFSKEFEGWSTKPQWNWIGEVKRGEHTIQFVVSKATPDEECVPRQEVYSYKTWICKRR